MHIDALQGLCGLRAAVSAAACGVLDMYYRQIKASHAIHCAHAAIAAAALPQSARVTSIECMHSADHENTASSLRLGKAPVGWACKITDWQVACIWQPCKLCTCTQITTGQDL